MNQVLCGDNLELLRELDSGIVDLVYLDPPFFTQRDFGEFNDKWQGLDDYLEFMEARLVELHRILKSTGSLYLHCDPKTSHYLKVMLDKIFGRKNFRNEIVWRIGWVSGFKTQKKGWIRNHDIILYYLKSDKGKTMFNKEYIPYPNGYTKLDGTTPSGEGFSIEDTWNCTERDVIHSLKIKTFSKTKYPTQKPLKLLERIIKASSNEGDLVLDPFCGSGTTLVAAKNLGRNYLGMDSSAKAVELSLSRLGESDLFENI